MPPSSSFESLSDSLGKFACFKYYLRFISASGSSLFLYIYILSVVALDETNFSGYLHFSMQNIEMSCDLDRTSRQSNVNVSQ